MPLKAWVKNALDHVIQVCMNEPGLEFVWVGDDAIDPLQQAQTLKFWSPPASRRARRRARTWGWRRRVAKSGAAKVAKFNPYHDPDNGQFTTADGAAETGGGAIAAPKVEPAGLQVAALDNFATDAADEANSSAQAPDSETSQIAQGETGQKLGASKYSVDLAAEEAYWGGHGVRDHVGIPKSQLIEELQSSRVDTPLPGGGVESTYRIGEGSYLSLSSANDFVNRVLESHQYECDMVGSGAWDETWLNDRFGYPTGIEATLGTQGDIVTRSTYNAGVLIVYDPRVPRGYRVKTTYPNNLPML